jgi:hypothetical protein
MAHHSGKQRQPLEEALAKRLAARREAAAVDARRPWHRGSQPRLLVLAGVSSGSAFVATLACRLVSYWLPVLTGGPADLMFRHRYGAAWRRSSEHKPTNNDITDVRPRQAARRCGGVCRTLDSVRIDGKNHDGFGSLTGSAAWKATAGRDSRRR